MLVQNSTHTSSSCEEISLTESLSPELLQLVLEKLPEAEQGNVAQVSKKWKSIVDVIACERFPDSLDRISHFAKQVIGTKPLNHDFALRVDKAIEQEAEKNNKTRGECLKNYRRLRHEIANNFLGLLDETVPAPEELEAFWRVRREYREIHNITFTKNPDKARAVGAICRRLQKQYLDTLKSEEIGPSWIGEMRLEVNALVQQCRLDEAAEVLELYLVKGPEFVGAVESVLYHPSISSNSAQRVIASIAECESFFDRKLPFIMKTPSLDPEFLEPMIAKLKRESNHRLAGQMIYQLALHAVSQNKFDVATQLIQDSCCEEDLVSFQEGLVAAMLSKIRSIYSVYSAHYRTGQERGHSIGEIHESIHKLSLWALKGVNFVNLHLLQKVVNSEEKACAAANIAKSFIDMGDVVSALSIVSMIMEMEKEPLISETYPEGEGLVYTNREYLGSSLGRNFRDVAYGLAEKGKFDEADQLLSTHFFKWGARYCGGVQEFKGEVFAKICEYQLHRNGE